MSPNDRSRGERWMRLAIFAALATLVVTLIAAVGLRLHGPLIVDAASPLGGDIDGAKSDRPGTRVLFVGNSLTYVNDMPELLEQLVASDPSSPPLYAVSYAPGGYTLAQDATDPAVRKILDEVRFNDVVLQENSNISRLEPDERANWMDPPARALAQRIRSQGARPILFLTWGYRTGSPDGFGSYAEMQAQIDHNYDDVARELAAPVAPAGRAWAEALRERPGIALWEPDGVHPSALGAYLDACVFYAFLLDRDPASSFHAGLTATDAEFLQRVAAKVVRGDG